MKNTISLIILNCLFIGTFAQNLDRSIRPKPGPAPEVKMGNAQSFISSNGIKVFVVENHKLPVVSYSIDFDIRPELQGNMTGYHDMIGDLFLSGTQKKSKDQLNAELDALGTGIAINSDGIYSQVLKKNSDKLLSLLSEIITKPNFTEEELKKLKKQMKSNLATQQDDPEAMSSNITRILNYGKKHPYGEVPSEQTVDNITLEICKKYYETYFRPNVAYMAIVGDITLAEAKAQVEKHFASWQKKDVPRANYPTPKAGSGPAVAVVNKSGAVQSVIDITYPLDMKQGHPDEIKLKVANGILGGGSTGRLFQNLREDKAWTYGSYSSFRSDELPGAGSFSATANATTQATDSAVGEILKEMHKLRTEMVSNEELEGYKNYMAGTFALGLEDPKTLARFAINERKYNMPANYYKNYLKNVDAVTAKDVMEVANKYIQPGIATISVAGDKKQVAEKLKQFGPVTIYDMQGNIENDVPAAAVPANISAKDIIQKHIDATGGNDKWNAVKDMTMEMTTEMQGMNINIKTMRKAPNKLMVEIAAMGQTFQKIVFDGQKGYTSQMGQKKDFDKDEIAEYTEEAYMIKDIKYLNPNYKTEVKGIEKVNGADAYWIEITKDNGDKISEYYSVQNGFKVKTEQTESSPQGTMTQTTYYSDYKDGPGGLKYPNAMKQSVGPQTMDMKLQKVQINTDIGDDTFK